MSDLSVGDDHGAPVIYITAKEFERWENGKPYGRLDAYMWTAIYGPVRASYRELARKWKWTESKVRRFIHSMVGAGLFKLDGLSIIAVELPLAAPAPIEGNWESLRSAVFARDGHRCTYCGSDENLQCDHIHPRAKGGADVLSNLTTACRSCNASKRDRLLSEWRQ